MNVESALQEIDEANSEHHTTAGYEADREEYERVLRSAHEAGGGAAVEAVLKFVAGRIREGEGRPTAEETRERAVAFLRGRGHEVPADLSG
jgi:hypothetical protein